jgi:hypothetical protein
MTILQQEMSLSNQKGAEAEMEQVNRGLFTGASKSNSVAANMAATKIKFAWLIIVAVLMQRMPFALSAPSSFVELKKALLVLSYVLLLWALSRNFHLWSMRILLLGTALNFAAIVANGGLMPVSPEARLQAGMPAIGQPGFSKVLPEGTGVLLPLDQTNLWFLSDIIPISLVGGVFSPGDVLIGVGLLIFFMEATRLSATPIHRKGSYLFRLWAVLVRLIKKDGITEH